MDPKVRVADSFVQVGAIYCDLFELEIDIVHRRIRPTTITSKSSV
jgi:hypothetical protein